MDYSQLYSYKPIHAIFGESHVRQSISRITQSGKHRNGQGSVTSEDAAYFLYCLASSRSTRYIPLVMEYEQKLVNKYGNRFVRDFGNLLSDERFIKTVKKIDIGRGCAIIYFNDGANEIYTAGSPSLGTRYEFDNAFLVRLFDKLK